MITLKMSTYKRSQSRSCSYPYKDLVKVLEQHNWTHSITPPATMIVNFQKSFETKELAIKGRKEITEALKTLVHNKIPIRLDEVC